jgi:N-acetylglucosaminyldiphosphoundecaprenol N-acetyl-beta-D-mannosaminyltransferase
MNINRKVINFLGVKIDPVDTPELLDRVVAFACEKQTHKVMYANADCILIAQNDPEYRKILNNAHLVYADGIGIILGAKIFGHHIQNRSTGADFMPRFCQKFADKGLKIFLLGARPGVAELAAQKLMLGCPQLQIAGTHHGYFRPFAEGRIVNSINRAKPHILLIGLGAPYQEKWIEKNYSFIEVPVIWGVGGLFDFLSGKTKRGPQLLLDNGFEWLCRLCVEPRRLWKRYLIGNSMFAWKVLKWKYFRQKGQDTVHGHR